MKPRISVPRPLRACLLVIVVTSLTACSRDFINYAELSVVTSDGDYFPVPVVFIPGLKGTKLSRLDERKGERVIWGYSGHVAAFSGFSELTLDYERQSASDPIAFGRYYRERRIFPTELLMAYKLAWKGITFHDYVVYREIRDFFVDDGQFELNKSLFFLEYDWRLDNRVAAVRLALALGDFRADYEKFFRSQVCRRKRGYDCAADELDGPDMRTEFREYLVALRKKYPDSFTNRPGRDPEVRFHIVAHSMGGLVAQYFMTQLGGSADVHSLVTLGTPTKGAMDALRALVEGEYPDTLWSNIVGVLFFEKRSTNAITGTFPATFQLLPRYRSAVEGIPPGDLGLTNTPSELTGDRLNAIIEAYRRFGGLPDARDVSRALGHEVPASIVETHFRNQLVSAACFHAALDGDLDEGSPVCDERRRVAEAMEFLSEAYRDRPDAVRGLTNAERRDAVMAAALSGTGAERRVVYGGHCTETVSRARVDPAAKGIRFLGSSEYAELRARDESERAAGEAAVQNAAVYGEPPSARYYGDGRVPFESAHFRRHNEKWVTSFFLCSDHVGLVKDDSFKYNLLRALRSR